MASGTGAIRAGRAFVEIFADTAKLSKGLQSAKSTLQSVGASSTATGKALLAAGATAGAPFAAAVGTFARFESSMSRVKALTNASGAEFKSLEDRALELGAQTQYTAAQAADAMGNFALAGFNADQILKATGPTLNLAAAGQIELAEASDIVATVMAGVGVAADDVGGAVDIMAKAMSTANTDIRGIGDAIKFVGPIAKTAGISFEETMAAVQALSNAGMKGEMAGTVLRGAILSLTSPSEEAKKQFQALGLQTKDSAGNFLSLAEIVTQLDNATRGMGSADKLQALGDIFAQRQAGGFAELVTQGGPKLAAMTAALKDAGGTADRIANVQLDNLKGDAIIALSSLEGLGIMVGKVFGEDLRRGTQGIVTILNATSKWVTENKETVQTIAGVVVGALAAGAALVAFGLSMSVMGSAVGGIGAVVGFVGSAFSVLLGPVGLAAAALAGLIALGLKFSGTARQMVADVLPAWGAAWETASGAVKDLVAVLAAGDIEGAAAIAMAGLRAAWAGGMLALTKVWVGFKGTVADGAAEAARAVMDVFNLTTDQLADSWGSLQSVWVKFTAFLADAWDVAMGGIGSAWSSTQNFISKGILELMGMFNEDLDVEDAKRSIDENARQARDQASRERNDRIGARGEQTRDALAGIKADQQSRRDAFAAFMDKRNRDAAGAAQIGAAAAALAEAMADLQAARDAGDSATAADAAAAVEAARQAFEKTTAPAGPGGRDDAGRTAAEQIASTITGSFSSERLGQSGGLKGPQEKTAVNTSKTVEKLDVLIQATRANRPVEAVYGV